MLAGAMRRQAVAVEARLLHVQMIHHAVQLNRLHKYITLLHNAVADSHNELQLLLTGTFF